MSKIDKIVSIVLKCVSAAVLIFGIYVTWYYADAFLKNSMSYVDLDHDIITGLFRHAALRDNKLCATLIAISGTVTSMAISGVLYTCASVIIRNSKD